METGRRITAFALGVWSLGGLARGQALPPEAAAPEAKRLSLGGEALASVATRDTAYFDYTTYGQSAMRLVRLRLDASLRLGAYAALLGEVRAENGDGLSVSALYLRVHPWRGHALDIQVGRIPLVFGAFGRRSYGTDNPLIGLPLAYQYLTSLRSDSVPGSADDILRMRGRGWRTRYPVGSSSWDRGLPLVRADRWDTGVEVRLGVDPVSVSGAVTNGTLSDPRVWNDDNGRQVSGRLEVRPSVGLILGVSAAARGEYLSHNAMAALPYEAQRGSYTQRAVGVDVEYSRGYWLLRGEGVLSEWRVPSVEAPLLREPLKALGTFVEGRYKIQPGLYAAVRVDHLGFSRISGSLFGGQPTTWDAPVSRLEVGGGYNPRRNLLLKAVYQHDWREGSYASESVVGAQAVLWF